ncbi:phage tail protein [Leptothoe spongobia]|uniref:Phage tail protein n=1 Tax=Leptothoe spongobia TAU-MAC 1115 TaxID=1967444 RepID=A0A947DHC7_9CYAN|nr:phage tail protein [Leptothoe spongobia]MBT9316668.1 phage tail protein [Leptothoe spongobia TAU-MAC 1115]
MTTNEAPKSTPQNYVTANRFYVEMESDVKASFSECSGLDVQIDKDVYFEGGVNEQQRIFLKHAKFGDITLKRGITDDLSFWDWINTFLEAKPAERRNINILTFNQAGETMQVWTLLAAVPVAWKTPSLQANSTSMAIEELTLAYEGLKVAAKTEGGSGASVFGGRSESGYYDASKSG